MNIKTITFERSKIIKFDITIRYVQEVSKGGQYTLLKSTQDLVIVFGLNRKTKRSSIAINKYFFKNLIVKFNSLKNVVKYFKHGKMEQL